MILIYPGCLATILFKIPDGTTIPVTTEFSDGSFATAEGEQMTRGEAFILIDACTTARGTRIPEKSWRLRYDSAADLWKVTAIT